MKRFCLLLSLLFFVSSSAWGAEITGLRVETSNRGDHVSVRLSEKVKFKVFRVEVAPPRVAVDFENTEPRYKIAVPDDYHGALIHSIRFGYHDETTGRLVFDLTTDIRPEGIRFIGSGAAGGYWLEFDLPAPEKTAEKTDTLVPQFAPSPHHKHTAAVKPKREAKPMIILDAGHGGQDPGTSGFNGTHEKDLTLRYALALQQSLLRTGHYRVTLTRSDDRYLLLRERVRRARAAHGDLFISLHADSAPTRFARGLSVYTISETASDKESEALAAQENKADVIGGMDLTGASEDVADILIDLAERETRGKSAEFADLAIKYLGKEVGLLSNTHRFAGFAVLKAPDIPSVLVEIGFLTNPKEEAQLKSRSYESRVVRGLTQAVEDYYGKRK